MFLHRLALALHKTVDEIERTMPAREQLDWLRFEARHQPLPDRLADLHSGLICSLAVNLTRGADQPPATPADFFVIREPQPAIDDGVGEVDRQMRSWRGG